MEFDPFLVLRFTFNINQMERNQTTDFKMRCINNNKCVRVSLFVRFVQMNSIYFTAIFQNSFELNG